LRFPFYFSFLLIVGALLPLVVDIVFTAAAIRATITVALVVMLVFAKFANHNCPQVGGALLPLVGLGVKGFYFSAAPL
jgi:hypothetical protein